MDAVGAVDVSPPRRAEHGPVSAGRAGKAVRGRVVPVIGLCLHNRAADPVHEEGGPEEIAGDLQDRPREEGCREHRASFGVIGRDVHRPISTCNAAAKQGE